MTTQHPADQLIPLELTRDDIVWLRAFLDQERSAANIDCVKAEDFHAIAAARAAMNVINREREMMTKIIDEICGTLDAIDAHEALVGKLNAALDQPAA